MELIVTNRETIDHSFSIDREEAIELMVEHAKRDRQELELLNDRELAWEFDNVLNDSSVLADECRRLIEQSDSMEDEWFVEAA